MSRPPKAPKRPPPVRYGPGHYATAPNGRGYDCTVVRTGVRSRTRVPTEQEARAWIDATDAAAADSLPPLTRAQLLDARDALSLLPPSATLAAAARHYLATVLRPPSSVLDPVPFSEAATRFLTERAHGAKPITLRKYRQLLALIRKSLPAPIIQNSKSLILNSPSPLNAPIPPNALPSLPPSSGLCPPSSPLSAVTPALLETLLASKTGRTRNAAIGHWQTFFRWALSSGLIPSDPSARLTRSRPPEPPIGVLTVPQTAALLSAAAKEKPHMVPYLALALFAGIRPGELSRLMPAKIGREYIMLDGAVTKTADARHVRIRPNLAAWLKSFPPDPSRPITPRSAKHLYEAIRALCEKTQSDTNPSARIKAWPLDCMRHSFATYTYELTKDAAATAAEMGHRGTDIFFRHYRALSTPGDGARFFAIRPAVGKPLAKTKPKRARTNQNEPIT